MMRTNIQPDTRSGLALLRVLLLIVALALSFIIMLQIQNTRKRMAKRLAAVETLQAALADTNNPAAFPIMEAGTTSPPAIQGKPVPILLVPLDTTDTNLPVTQMLRHPPARVFGSGPLRAAPLTQIPVGQAQVVYYQRKSLTFVAVPVDARPAVSPVAVAPSSQPAILLNPQLR